MKLESLMTSEEIRQASVPQAYFGRVIGISKMRVSQLLKAGLLIGSDEGGIVLVESLRRFFSYQLMKGCYSLEEFIRRKIAG